MKKAVAKVWVEALRSGKYEQGKGALKQDNKYCCLGVLCELSGLSEFEEGSYDEDKYFNEQGYLPEEVMKWSGVKNKKGNLNNKWITGLNDWGTTFLEMADLIENNYKVL